MRCSNGSRRLLLLGFGVAAVLLALLAVAIPRTVTAVRIRGGPTEGSSVLSWRVELVEVGDAERVAAYRQISLRWTLANGERGTTSGTLDDEGAANVTIVPGTGPVAGPVHVKVYASGASGPIVDAPLSLTRAAWIRGAHRRRGSAATSTIHAYVDKSPMLREPFWWGDRPSGCVPCRLVIEAVPTRQRAYVVFVSPKARLAGATIELINGRGLVWLPPFPGDDPVWALVSSSPAPDESDRVSLPIRSGSGPATTFDVPDAVLFDNVSENTAFTGTRLGRVLLSVFLLPVITAGIVLIAVWRRARSAQLRFDESLALLGETEETFTPSPPAQSEVGLP